LPPKHETLFATFLTKDIPANYVTFPPECLEKIYSTLYNFLINIYRKNVISSQNSKEVTHISTNSECSQDCLKLEKIEPELEKKLKIEEPCSNESNEQSSLDNQRQLVIPESRAQDSPFEDYSRMMPPQFQSSQFQLPQFQLPQFQSPNINQTEMFKKFIFDNMVKQMLPKGGMPEMYSKINKAQNAPTENLFSNYYQPLSSTELLINLEIQKNREATNFQHLVDLLKHGQPNNINPKNC